MKSHKKFYLKMAKLNTKYNYILYKNSLYVFLFTSYLTANKG
jgi:hypothetical protein